MPIRGTPNEQFIMSDSKLKNGEKKKNKQKKSNGNASNFELVNI